MILEKIKIKNVFEVAGMELHKDWKRNMHIIILENDSDDTNFYISTLKGFEKSARGFDEWETLNNAKIQEIDFKKFIGKEVENIYKSKGTKGYYWLNKFERNS